MRLRARLPDAVRRAPAPSAHLMRVLIVHNEYGRHSGEEGVVDQYTKMLTERGHEVARFTRSSASLGDGLRGRALGFVAGLGSPRARRELAAVLRTEAPDVVNVHNVFPLISPLALDACGEADVPVLMTVHNYRLICPTGLLYSGGEVCERCAGGKEYHCVLRNCEGSWFKSLGYAARSALARWRGDFRRNVTVYAALTEFQRERLVASGIPAAQVVVIPNGAPVEAVPPQRSYPGEFIAFVGRISQEKGISDLSAAARRNPDIPFELYGHADRAGPLLQDLPANVRAHGHVEASQLVDVYRRCRVLVAPSRWYEGFPLSVVEAMSHGCPVIGPAHGGFPEVIEDGRTGRLFQPADAGSLARVIAEVWAHPASAAVMGAAAHARALAIYSMHAWADRLVGALDATRRAGAPRS